MISIHEAASGLVYPPSDQLRMDITSTVHTFSKPYLLYPQLTNLSECCYSFQYMKENRRNVGDPWSLRQTAVYHQFHQKDGQSCWIILQIATGMRVQFEQALSDKRYRNSHDGVDPVRLHVDFLSAMASNWARYLECLHTQLAELVSSTWYLWSFEAHDKVEREGMLFTSWKQRSYRLPGYFQGLPAAATAPPEASQNIAHA